MNILVIIENTEFNRQLAQEVSRLAANTWANVTLLGYVPQSKGEIPEKARENIILYREEILSSFPEKSGPYSNRRIVNWISQQNGSSIAAIDSGQKDLDLILVKKWVTKDPMSCTRKTAIDLLILGDTHGLETPWMANVIDAAGSILVVKGSKSPKQIVCCLNHHDISHYSLEMINQLATLYSVELKIVGFTDYYNSNNIKQHIESQLQYLLDYYTDLNLTPWLELVDKSIMAQFILQESKENLIALWIEKDTVRYNPLAKNKISTVISAASSSLLLLH